MPNFIGNYLQKFGVNNRSTIDLSSNVLHTQDIGKPTVTYCQRIYPSDKVNLTAQSFIRADNLPFPTLSDLNLHHRSFFVRMRNIWSPFESFITKQSDEDGNLLYSQLPSVHTDFLRHMILYGQYISGASAWSDYNNYTMLGYQSPYYDYSSLVDGSRLSSWIDKFGHLDLTGSVTLKFQVWYPIQAHKTGAYQLHNIGEDMTSIGQLTSPNYPHVKIVKCQVDDGVVWSTLGTVKVKNKAFNDISLDSCTYDNPGYMSLKSFYQFVQYLEGKEDAFDTLSVSSLDYLKGFTIADFDLFENAMNFYSAPLSINTHDKFYKAGFYLPLKFDSYGYNRYINGSIQLTATVLYNNAKQLLTTFAGLGIVFPICMYSTDGTYTSLLEPSFNFLRIASLARIVYDHFIPTEFKQQDALYAFFGTSVAPYTYSQTDKEVIINRLADTYFLYDRDYFTSAWQTPSGDNTFASKGITDSTLENIVSNDFMYQENAPTINENHGVLVDNGFSAQVHKWLSKLQDYSLNRKIFGTELKTILKNTFGVDLPDTITNESTILGADRVPIQIGDINCTSDGQNNQSQSLGGDYFGKAIGSSVDYSPTLANFTSDDYGFLMVLSGITPVPMYASQGYDKNTRALIADDFATPDFDGLGTQIVENGELYFSHTNGYNFVSGQTFGVTPMQTFGYLPRYSESKVGRDNVLGDYRLNSRNTLLKNHFLARKWSKISSALPLQKDLKFLQIRLNDENNNYDEMFNYIRRDYDHFYCRSYFNVKVNRALKSIEASLPYIDEGDASMHTTRTSGITG